MVDNQSISIIFAGLSIAASIVYYASVLRNANKTKDRELINQRLMMITDEFYSKWNQMMFGEWSNFEEWLTSPSGRAENGDILNYFCTLFNSVGLLIKNRMLDSDLIFSVYAPHFVIVTWEKVSPVVKGSREVFNYYELFSGFEYLYNEAKRQYPDIRGGEAFQALGELLDTS